MLSYEIDGHGKFDNKDTHTHKLQEMAVNPTFLGNFLQTSTCSLV